MQSIREAEAVKVVENTFRDINIAYVNELAMSFAKLGIDVVHVIDAAATKPFGFMPHYPKCGVGGHCIPVDPYYLMAYASRHGFEHELIKTARTINNHMPSYTVELVEGLLARAGRPLAGAQVALLGLSYKADVPDLRESPALTIHEELRTRGALVVAYDPYIATVDGIMTAESLDAALTDADAVVLATNHREFCELSPRDLAAHDIEIIVDGCNCLDKDAFVRAGIAYRGIGR
jgi:nucleotide sugar dehydrogenase